MRAHLPALVLAATLTLPALPARTRAQTMSRQPELNEWTVPYERSRPRDPMVAPDGSVFFVGQTGDYVGRLDPGSGSFTKFDLDDGTGPHNLVVDPDGIVWYTGNASTHIGRLDPATGEVRKIPMPDPAVRDPHTLMFDRNGDMWFTAQQANFIGHLTKATGEVRLIEAPQAAGRGGMMTSSRPYGIVMDSRDRPWIALFNANKIATVDPATFELTTFDLPDPGARPRRIGITSDDIIWYTDYARGYLGRLDPSTGEVEEWKTPSGGNTAPYGMAVDDSDRIWFVETGVEPNMFVGFDPRTESFTGSVPLESGGGTVRNMYFDAETNSVWFGADTNTIGVAKLPPRRRPISD